MLEIIAVCTGVVWLGEMGDKTQLLALLLAARFRRPWPIVLGILVATIVNHAGAARSGSGCPGSSTRSGCAGFSACPSSRSRPG